MCRIKCDRSIAIIPARGGSKGVPRKNIRDLCGKPLIAYTIEAALEADVFDKVIVTTDDQEIADVSTAYGAYVPFLRPADLATDTANVMHGISYTMDRLYDGWRNVTALAIMFPTSPFRKISMISELMGLILDGDYSQVSTVRHVQPPFGNYWEANGQGLDTLASKSFFDQHLLFRPYGVMSASRGSSGAEKVYTHVLKDEIEYIDIDTWEDFYLAQTVIENGLYDFNGDSSSEIGCSNES